MPAFSDNGLVLARLPYSESSFIVTILTQHNGLQRGLWQGRTASRAPEAGTWVQVEWRARLHDHLGRWRLESQRQPLATHGYQRDLTATVGALCALLTMVLPPQHPYPTLYDHVQRWLDRLHPATAVADYVRLEVLLLAELGYGLQLQECALSGVKDNLVYVSPKTGRAVTAAAADGYHDKLLLLPAFINDNSVVPNAAETAAGLQLTAYFLSKHLIPPPRSLPRLRSLLYPRPLPAAA